MSSEESATIEFVYDASFYFDDLPNNQKQGQQPVEDKVSTPIPPTSKKLQPAWYQAAKAPVPFNEDVFWQVLERWILEAPTIIPPISKVEIISDHSSKVAAGGKESGKANVSPSPYSLDREQALLESNIPFRTIRRQLLPKRAKKDSIMMEQLYYVRPQQPLDTGATERVAGVTNHAIFAPIITTQQSETIQDEDEIKIMMKTLPFYYPKVRGFRYGYVQDQEDDPEDEEDHCHAHDDEGESYEYEQREEEETITKGGTKDVAVGGKAKVMSKRAGWITLDLFLAGDEGEFTDKMQYAFKELFKKLYKWGVNTTRGFTKSRVQHDIMVPKELYLSTYARLKETHAQKWVQSWPEKTDPRKFVFEDIAIASWLVALWELERQGGEGSRQDTRKQTFVDLGCGNGLLTHILNEEGHKGKGIDIVARKVWDIYGSDTQLEATTVIPNETAFDDADWIIGNHADELAPWIPIIAMRSKPLTRFVVIPCCFFDLNGSRYQFPKGNPEGKYKAYQDYICTIIETCGYDLQTEILRIPSTKNVALIGMGMKKRKRGDGHTLDVGDEECRERIEDLVRRSGLFVARVSDKDKQELQKSKHAAKLLAREQGPEGN